MERLLQLVPPERPSWAAPLSDKLLIACFAVFLASPAILWIRGEDTSGLLIENRNLASAPSFRADPLVALPGEIEAYFEDHFGFRAALIRLYGRIVHKDLRASSADVIMGKGDWIFYARDNVFTDFFGFSQFTPEELKRWDRHLEVRRAILAEQNIRYMFVVAPDKNTIYPENLPLYIQRNRGRSRLEQLKEYLRSRNSRVEFLDLHQTLIAAKPDGLQYFPQDTHWNGRGMFTGYLAIAERLRPWFPEISPRVLGRDYEVHRTPGVGGDWNLLGLPEENLSAISEFLFPLGPQPSRKVPPPPIPGLTKSRVPWFGPLAFESDRPGSILILHDSFMRTGSLDGEEMPLRDNFGRTLMIGGPRPDRDLQTLVDVFHPDVVIEETGERRMADIPPISRVSFAAEAIAVSPTDGRGRAARFVISHASPPGAEDVGSTQLAIGAALSNGHSCWVTYSVAQNEFLLWDDAGKAQLTGASPGKGSVTNSQCTILGSESSAAIQNNRLVVNYSIQFKNSFAGPKRIWANASSAETGLNSAWKKAGTWVVTR